MLASALIQFNGLLLGEHNDDIDFGVPNCPPEHAEIGGLRCLCSNVGDIDSVLSVL